MLDDTNVCVGGGANGYEVGKVKGLRATARSAWAITQPPRFLGMKAEATDAE